MINVWYQHAHEILEIPAVWQKQCSKIILVSLITSIATHSPRTHTDTCVLIVRCKQCTMHTLIEVPYVLESIEMLGCDRTSISFRRNTLAKKWMNSYPGECRERCRASAVVEPSRNRAQLSQGIWGSPLLLPRVLLGPRVRCAAIVAVWARCKCCPVNSACTTLHIWNENRPTSLK